MDLDLLLQEVKAIARQAGAAILDIYQHPESFETTFKADHSPLTKADQESNAIICRGLEQLNPRFPIISEENKVIPFSTRKNFTYCWIVDPLDGTKEFTKRNDDFTVNIGLIFEQKVILGVIYVPVVDELYWAAEGKGAFFQKGDTIKRMQAATFRYSDRLLKLVCSRSHLNAQTEAFVQQFEAPELIPRGSSLKFTIIANGAAHLYPRLAPTMEWDTAAAQIILEEAGGAVLHAESGKTLLYNKEDLHNPNFIARGKVAD